MRTLARPHDRTELVARLRRVTPDHAPRWGRMTAHQMVCHVADAFRMALGEKRTAPRSGPLQRTLKWVVLYAPLRWPSGIATSSELDQLLDGCTRPSTFAADVDTAELLLERTARGPVGDWPSHPIFGSMTEAQWHRWGWLHVDHHLRQFGE